MSSTILRAARQVSRVRAFGTSAVARKDLVQDVYLREIKAYKPAAIAKDAHVGAVKAFALPPTPKIPTLPTDLASELSAYDAAEPTAVDAPAAAATGAVSAEGAQGADGFLAFLEQDVPKPVHHH